MGTTVLPTTKRREWIRPVFALPCLLYSMDLMARDTSAFTSSARICVVLAVAMAVLTFIVLRRRQPTAVAVPWRQHVDDA